jgi:transcriptional regulator with XRE-family HTH domain
MRKVGIDVSSKERLEFSQRLQQALQNADYAPDSPTLLAREFNIRFDGTAITVHAARKWLLGEAIPTQEKLRALAQWFGVSAEWLRFGGDDSGSKGPATAKSAQRLDPRDLAILENLHRLDEKHRQIVHTLIRQLVHANERK